MTLLIALIIICLLSWIVRFERKTSCFSHFFGVEFMGLLVWLGFFCLGCFGCVVLGFVCGILFVVFTFFWVFFVWFGVFLVFFFAFLGFFKLY